MNWLRNKFENPKKEVADESKKQLLGTVSDEYQRQQDNNRKVADQAERERNQLSATPPDPILIEMVEMWFRDP